MASVVATILKVGTFLASAGARAAMAAAIKSCRRCDSGLHVRPEAEGSSRRRPFFLDRSSLDSQLAQLLLQALAVESNLDSRSADVAVIFP